MFTYADGSQVQVGDSVLIEHGRTAGTVELVVCTAQQMAEIGVTQPGVMLLSAPFGRVYLPQDCWYMDPLLFVSHGPKA
jgi:hypothetical protein